MPINLPSTIKNLYKEDFPSESWHPFASEDGKQVFLFTRRDSAGACSWALYIDDNGTRTAIRTSSVHLTPDQADVEWFQTQITLDPPKHT